LSFSGQVFASFYFRFQFQLWFQFFRWKFWLWCLHMISIDLIRILVFFVTVMDLLIFDFCGCVVLTWLVFELIWFPV
jgi:hypothetical protein